MDLPSPFEYLFVHDLKLGRCRRNKLAGVRQPWDKGATQYVDFAVDRRWTVAYGVEVTVELYLVVVELRLPFWVQIVLAA